MIMAKFLKSMLARRVALLLVFSMTIISLVPKVDAAFIPSDESFQSTMRQQDMAVVQKILENKLVKERLQALGYSDQEIDQRLAQLSDDELHQLATQLDSLAPGGDALWVIIALLIIVILIIVILKLTDKKIIIG